MITRMPEWKDYLVSLIRIKNVEMPLCLYDAEDSEEYLAAMVDNHCLSVLKDEYILFSEESNIPNPVGLPLCQRLHLMFWDFESFTQENIDMFVEWSNKCIQYRIDKQKKDMDEEKKSCFEIPTTPERIEARYARAEWYGMTFEQIIREEHIENLYCFYVNESYGNYKFTREHLTSLFDWRRKHEGPYSTEDWIMENGLVDVPEFNIYRVRNRA
jgi:hypothetical protein